MLNFSIDKKFVCIFWISLLISTLYIYPFTILDRYQVDDLGRSIMGYTQWSSNGRPLADYLFIALSAGYPIMDLSPLTQFLSIASLCFALTAYMWRFNEMEHKVQASLAIFIFVGNPFFLENLSFKFDSLGMALSAVFLIMIFTIKKSKRGFFLSVLFIVFSLSLYQAAIGLYAIFFVVETVLKYHHDKQYSKNFSRDILYFLSLLLAGYTIYHFSIKEFFVNDEYSISHSGIIPLSKVGLIQAKTNFQALLRLVMLYVNSAPWPFVALYVSLSIIALAKIIRERSIIENKRYVHLTLFLLCSPLLIFLLSFIHLSILNHPIISPRVLISFGGLMFFIAILSNILMVNRWISLIALAPIVGFSFLYSYSIANATNAQDRMDNLILSSVAYDLNHTEHPFENILIYGTMPSSDQRSLVASRFPIASRVIPIFFNTNDYWGVMKLRHYLIKLNYSMLDSNDLIIMCKSDPLIRSKIYSIYANGTKAILAFENPKCE